MSNKYFSKLNYTLANEDTTLEVLLTQRVKSQSILSVGGSGGRALPLLANSPKSLHYLDIGKEQLLLIELRKATIKELNHQQFLQFWGYPPYDNDTYYTIREKIFQTLTISNECREFFEEIFQNNQYGSILYLGKWEQTFAKFSVIAQKIMGKKNLEKLLQIESIEEQREHMKSSFPLLRWKLTLSILGNAAVFNALLYKGHFVKKNIPQTHYQFYKKVFNYLFNNTLVRDNFFLQLCFFGKVVTPSAIPVEGREDIFTKCKEWLQNDDRTKGILSDLLEYPDKTEEKFDFVSTSDVPSYFSGETEKNFMQHLKKTLSPGALVINRYYLHIPQNVDLTDYEDVTESHRDLIAMEKVQVYDVKIYRLKN